MVAFGVQRKREKVGTQHRINKDENFPEAEAMGAQNEETQEGISVMEKKKRVIGIGCEKDCGNGDA
nr:hypothetical protein Iba_chr15aCG6570 [Ipomoea batatas]